MLVKKHPPTNGGRAKKKSGIKREITEGQNKTGEGGGNQCALDQGKRGKEKLFQGGTLDAAQAEECTDTKGREALW